MVAVKRNEVMGKYLQIIDKNTLSVPNCFRVAFVRNEELKKNVPLVRWLWLTFVEILVGEELLESLVTTSSHSGCPEDADETSLYGLPQQLYFHVPGGFINKILMRHIIEVLYYKYYKQYYFLDPLDVPRHDTNKNAIDVTRIRFRLKKDLLYQVIAFRRVYVASWVVLNFASDMVVFFGTNNIQWALVTAFVIEGIRRLLRV